MPTPIAASTIAAQAFRFLELSPISSFADDTPQAQDAAEQYPQALASCLSACDWSFASVLASLPAAVPGPTVAVDPALPHLFALPGDVIVLREVGDGWTRWRRDREGLRADEGAPLRIRYTGRVENEAALPATFQTAVALALAVLLAPRWLGTQSRVEGLKQDAARVLKQAMREDARQASEARYDGTPDQGDWVAEARW
jgi:hypothetical protein